MRYARGAIGVAISGIAIVLVVASVDIGRTAAILAAAAPGWIAVMAAAYAVDLLIRARRWQGLVAPIRAVPYRRMLGYLLIGYLANNVLPARLGELVRSHFLGEREGLSRSTALGTIIVERVVDTALVVLLAGLAILVLQVGGALTTVELIGFAFVAALVGALAIGIWAHRLPGAASFVAWVERWPRAAALARRLRDGLVVARRPRTLVGAIALSCGSWVVATIAYLAAARAIGLQIGVPEAALLASGVALATVVPSGPAFLGTFELAAKTIGGAIGIAAEPAVALAVLAHVGVVVVTSLGGLAALWRLGWRRPSSTGIGATPG